MITRKQSNGIYTAVQQIEKTIIIRQHHTRNGAMRLCTEAMARYLDKDPVIYHHDEPNLPTDQENDHE